MRKPYHWNESIMQRVDDPDQWDVILYPDALRNRWLAGTLRASHCVTICQNQSEPVMTGLHVVRESPLARLTRAWTEIQVYERAIEDAQTWIHDSMGPLARLGSNLYLVGLARKVRQGTLDTIGIHREDLQVENIPHAVFWTWENDRWLGVHLKYGESITFSTGGTHDEGWTQNGTTYTHDGDVVRLQWWDSGVDCDGRLDRAGESVCALDQLQSREPIDRDLPMRFPEWVSIDEYQRDHSAERMGY
jgi:hypothetical protein